jgi:hypothetical protein
VYIAVVLVVYAPQLATGALLPAVPRGVDTNHWFRPD